jgi:ribonuclease-3
MFNYIPSTRYIPGTRLTEESVEGLNSIIHYSARDLILLSESIEAPGSGVTPEGNKGLAQIGDAVLRLVIYLDGRRRHLSIGDYISPMLENLTYLLPGEIAAFHDRVASNTNLIRLGRSKELDRFVHGNPAQLGVVSDRLMSATVEAIIAVVFLDSGMDLAIVRQMLIELGILEK